MDKKEMMLFGGMALVLLLLLGYVYVEAEEHQKDMMRNHCKILHKNPDYTDYQFDAATKTVQPKTTRGHWFYECDDNEWRMD